MDQYSNNSQNEFLWSLLDNPANDAHDYVYNLQRLVNDFPQSGILQALLAHASEEKNLKQASAYFNPRSLFKLINAPSAFTGVPDERIVIQPGIGGNGLFRREQAPVYDEPLTEYREDKIEENTGEAIIDRNAPVDDTAPEVITYPVDREPFTGENAEMHPGGEVAGDTLIQPAAAEPEIAAPGDHAESGITEMGEAIGHEPETVALHQPADEMAVEKEEISETAAPEAETREPYAELNGEEASEQEAIPGITAPEAETPESYSELSEEEAPEQQAVSGTASPETEMREPFSELNADVTDEQGVIAQIAAPDAELPESFSGVNEEISAEQEKLSETSQQQTEIPYTDSRVTDEAGPQKEGPISTAGEVKEEDDSEMVTGTHLNEIVRPEPEMQLSDDIDETYDEIVGIEDIDFKQPAAADKFFSFDHEFGAHGEQHQTSPVPGEPVAKEAEQDDAGHQDVSKYYDEKMPYTFMWWLDKTRKEHEQAYQPYIKAPSAQNKKQKKITDELQQQYFENIFHITSVEELDKNTSPSPLPADMKKKEQVIIERFIKEEPQIKPQSSDKLDNENKAKKSSEDRDELVTETLAGIYSDQMLYHKAIASYKKLMLKFPEKTRYFADKIEQLEKKTN